MRELSARESVKILNRLNNGEFLTVVGDKYLFIHGKGRELSKQEKNIVYDACKKVGIHFFTEMSFHEYCRGKDYAMKVDKLLAMLQEYGIAMTCSLSKRFFYLQFVER